MCDMYVYVYIYINVAKHTPRTPRIAWKYLHLSTS